MWGGVVGSFHSVVHGISKKCIANGPEPYPLIVLTQHLRHVKYPFTSFRQRSLQFRIYFLHSLCNLVLQYKRHPAQFSRHKELNHLPGLFMVLHYDEVHLRRDGRYQGQLLWRKDDVLSKSWKDRPSENDTELVGCLELWDKFLLWSLKKLSGFVLFDSAIEFLEFLLHRTKFSLSLRLDLGHLPDLNLQPYHKLLRLTEPLTLCSVLL